MLNQGLVLLMCFVACTATGIVNLGTVRQSFQGQNTIQRQQLQATVRTQNSFGGVVNVPSSMPSNFPVGGQNLQTIVQHLPDVNLPTQYMTTRHINGGGANIIIAGLHGQGVGAGVRYISPSFTTGRYTAVGRRSPYIFGTRRIVTRPTYTNRKITRTITGPSITGGLTGPSTRRIITRRPTRVTTTRTVTGPSTRVTSTTRRGTGGHIPRFIIPPPPEFGRGGISIRGPGAGATTGIPRTVAAGTRTSTTGRRAGTRPTTRSGSGGGSRIGVVSTNFPMEGQGGLNNPWVEQQFPQDRLQMNSWSVDPSSITDNPVVRANQMAQFQYQQELLGGASAAYQPTLDSMYSVEGANILPGAPYSEGFSAVVPSGISTTSQGFIDNNPIVSEGFINNNNNNAMSMGGLSMSSADQLTGANIGAVTYPQLF